MPYSAEFVTWADITGDSGQGAIVRLKSAEDRVLSAVVRVSRSLMTTERWTSDDLQARLPDIAVRLVQRRAETKPAWVAQHRGETDVPLLISNADELT